MGKMVKVRVSCDGGGGASRVGSRMAWSVSQRTLTAPVSAGDDFSISDRP